MILLRFIYSSTKMVLVQCSGEFSRRGLVKQTGRHRLVPQFSLCGLHMIIPQLEIGFQFPIHVTLGSCYDLDCYKQHPMNLVVQQNLIE